jgi:hypothetical protein
MPPVTRAKSHATESLSGKDYALAAVVLIGIGIALLVLFVVLIPRLLPADILNQFFYIVLIVWGLVCALVLFGVMKSYARITYRHLGGVVELGGPAAFAALVVVGGFWLVPRTDNFTVTLRPHGPRAPLITSGKIRVEYGSRSDHADINSRGEAVVTGIPHKFWGTPVKILPQVEGYREEYQTIVLNKDAIDLDLLNALPPETLFKARLYPPPGNVQETKILIQGESGEAVPDKYGRFQFLVHKNLGENVRLNVCTSGRSVYDDYITVVEDEVEIATHKPDSPCSR